MKMFNLATAGIFLLCGSVFAQNDMALWQAAGEGNLDAVNEALAKGANPNWENLNSSWRTALVVASCFNHPTVVSVLLDLGADDIRIALNCAVKYSNPVIVKMLLNAGADPNMQEQGNGKTILYLATWRGNLNVVIALLEGGADPNIQRYDVDSRAGCTPLFEAAYFDFVAIATVLIDAHANVNIVADGGFTALHIAVQVYQREHGSTSQDMVRLLLRKGADVNQKDNIGRRTPVDIAIDNNEPQLAHLIESYTGPYDPPLTGTYTPIEDKALWQAAMDGDLDAVNGALARGANPNTWGKDDSGYTDTALNIATLNNYPAVVSALLDSGAHITYNTGTSALHLAARYNILDVVMVLLNAGADPNIQEDDNGRTPLYIATESRNIDVVKALLESGADPDIQQYYVKSYAGFTPLFEAAYNADVAITKALLDANANVRITAEDGSTALHHMISKYGTTETNRQDIVRLLLRKGADVNQKDNKGRTPGDLAIHYNRPHLANILESYSGPYDPTTTTTTVYDLYLLACRYTVLIAENLYAVLN